MRKIGGVPDTYRGDDPKTAALRLMHCLGTQRGTSYCLIGLPDVTTRNAPAADYLFEEIPTGRKLLVEHMEWVSPSEREAGALVQKGKTPRPPRHNQLVKDGLDALRAGVVDNEPVALISDRRIDSRQLDVLKSAIVAKIRKGQLRHCDAGERILLVDAGGRCA